MIALLSAGFVLGLWVAAPIGPVGAAVVREGLERGAAAAFLIGLGALLLGQMAYGSLKRAWEGGLPTPASAKGRGFLYGLGITLFNPATIISWLGLGGAFASYWLVGGTLVQGLAALLAVFAGSAAWFGFLAVVVGLVRRLAGERPWPFRLVNLAAGLMLAGFAVTFLLRVFGI